MVIDPRARDQRIAELAPRVVRLLVPKLEDRNDPVKGASFWKAIDLAAKSGARINLTYSGLTNLRQDDAHFER